MRSIRFRTLVLVALAILVVVSGITFWSARDRADLDDRQDTVALPNGEEVIKGPEVVASGLDAAVEPRSFADAGSGSADTGGAPENAARYWLLPVTAALRAVAAATPGDPDAEAWHQTLVSYCHRDTLAQPDAARIDRLIRGTGAGDHWMRDDPQLRARLADVLERQRQFCTSLGRIPTLTELWGADWAERAENEQGSINAMLLSIHQSDDPEAKAQHLDALGGIDGVWALALTSPSPTIRLSALQVLVGSGTGPFADLNRVIDGGLGVGMDPQQRSRLLQMVAAEVFVCRRFGHCGPSSLSAQRLATVGQLDALNGLEAQYRTEWPSRDWESIERLVARLSTSETQRATGRGPGS